MPRDIPVGNGRLLVCFDWNYCIRDLYYPHVGQENHVVGRFCRMGVWVAGRFSWIDESWQRELTYETDTMVTKVNLVQPDLGILLMCRDAVDFHEDIYVREITVENLEGAAREVRLFFSLDLGIGGNDLGDTAGYDPKTGALIHYKGARYFLAGGTIGSDYKLSQFAVGQMGDGGHEGTFKDAEDGVLSGNPIAQGSVDSVMALHLELAANSQGTAYFYLAAGQSWEEISRLDKAVRAKHPKNLLKRTEDYWRLWVRKESPALERLPENLADFYRRSLIIVRTQIDAGGGILAANDSDIVYFNRDTYSYVWPRDAALVAHALDQAGHPTSSRNFFNFISRLLQPEGCFLHKFNPDGTLASSWHPWILDGQPQVPIQEDSTALVLWALWHHFVLYRDLDFIKPLYRPLIKKAGNFLCGHRDKETGLPAPSYDLWEERRGILSFTTGVVFGGLTAAALFCQVLGEEEHSRRYQQTAAAIRDAASQYLWRPELNRFCRMISRDAQGQLHYDDTCDASLWGLFAFGLYTADDPRVVGTMSALREKLWLNTPVGGMARNEDDGYFRARHDLPGNPWFVCTLWLADYLLEKGTEEEIKQALEILAWVAEHALPSGVLPEQINPLTGEPLSVSPLTWSHGTYIATVHRYLDLMARKEEGAKPGVATHHIRQEDWIKRLYSQTCDSIRGVCKF